MTAHQAFDAATASLSPMCPQDSMHMGTAVSATAGDVCLANVSQQSTLLDGTLALWPHTPSVVGGGRNIQNAA
jgi:hypothetical protein